MSTIFDIFLAAAKVVNGIVSCCWLFGEIFLKLTMMHNITAFSRDSHELAKNE